MRLSITSLAGSVYRRRWWFIMAWLVMLAASAFFAPRLSEVTSGGGFDLPESESWRAADPRYREKLLKSLDRAAAGTGATSRITYYESGLPNMVSADGYATYALLSYSGNEEKIQPLVPRIRELAVSY